MPKKLPIAQQAALDALEPKKREPISINMAERYQFLPWAEEARSSTATQKLFVGGTGSGKSCSALMVAIIDYAMRWEGCNILCLRRTYAELEKGLIADFKTYVPEELWKFNETKKVATLWNKSKIYFGHLASGSEKDLHTYLSSSFVVIVIDECAQFSIEAWQFLKSRNRINPECQQNSEGKHPIPIMIGATNPIGPHWLDWHKVFVKKQPAVEQEGMRKAPSGRYYIKEAGEWRMIFDAYDYYHRHSTVFENPFMLAKDPGIVQRLELLPPEMRKKLLFGDMDAISGAYLSNFSHDKHVVNLRKDPERIVWRPWEHCWVSIDWGRAHWCGIHWFVKADLRKLDGSLKTVTVCYRELAVTGKSNVEVADLIARLSTRIDENGKRSLENIKSVVLSHEKFAKQMEAHSPADDFSRLLRDRGLPSVSRGTRDRIGRASLTYELLDRGELVLLDSCTETIKALPQLIRSDKNPEDVLKVDNKGDDLYDSFSQGLFFYLNPRPKPQATKDQERIQSLALNPFGQKLETMRQNFERQRKAELASMTTWERKYHESRKK